MKVIFPLSALIFFLFLAYLTHPGKLDGKNFLVFHLSVTMFSFCFTSGTKFYPYTLTLCHFFTMDTCVSEQIR